MAKVLTNPENYTAIANAIRAKGVEGQWKPNEMASAIASISGGSSGGGSGSTDLPIYNSAEEAYEGLRPKHWMKMIDIDWYRENVKKPEDGYIAWGVMLVRSATPPTNYYIPGVFTDVYIFYDAYNGNTMEHLASNTSISGGGNATPSADSYVFNEVDNMYESIICFAWKSDRQNNAVPYISSSNSATNTLYLLAKDLDLYYDTPNGTTNVNSASYAKNFSTFFSQLRFLRLRMPENRGYYAMGDGFFTGSNVGLQVVRECHIYPYSTSRTIKGPMLQYVKCDDSYSNSSIQSQNYILSSQVLEIDYIVKGSVASSITFNAFNGGNTTKFKLNVLNPDGLEYNGFAVNLNPYPQMLEFGEGDIRFYAPSSSTVNFISLCSSNSDTYGYSIYANEILKNIDAGIQDGRFKLMNSGTQILPENLALRVYTIAPILFTSEELEYYTSKGYTFVYRNGTVIN